MLRLVINVKAKASVVVFTWRCFNCKRMFRIPKRTYLKLMNKEISGVQCRRCLRPPSGSAAVAA